MKLKLFFVSLIFFIFAASSSFGILFDPTGSGGENQKYLIDFHALQWSSSASLLKDIDPTQSGDKFTVYSHATLTTFKNSQDKDVSEISTMLGYDIEITYVMGFGEYISGSYPGGTFDTFAFDPTNPTNFFQIYLDTTPDADPLEGTGFNDGTLIAWGNVVSSNGFFTMTDSQSQNLDQYGDDDWNGQQSVAGGGYSDVTTVSGPLHFNTDYFINLPPTYSLIFSETSYAHLPFDGANPSRSFWDGSGYITPDLGTINGLPQSTGGTDILIQIGGTSSIKVVPEPATMLLFGTSLLGLVGIGRRKLRHS